MDLVNLAITLLSGVAGGNLAGAGLKEKSLGTAGNSVVGAVGGGAGHWILQLLGVLATTAASSAVNGNQPIPGTESLDIGALIGNVVGSGAGGAILTALIAFLKNMLQENSHSDR